MPYSSFSLAALVNNQAAASQAIENRRLVSVMLMPENTGSGNAEFFGQIFLVSTETPEPTTIAILASGYLGASQPLGWTGSIFCDPTYAVQARIFSTSSLPVRCTMVAED